MPSFKVRAELTVTMDIEAASPDEAKAIAENALYEELAPAGYDFKHVRSLGLQAVAIQAGEVWRDDRGRLLAITRVTEGQTYYSINNSGEETYMRAHLFAFHLARCKARLVTPAPPRTT